MQAERRFLARTGVDYGTGADARKRSLERRVRPARKGWTEPTMALSSSAKFSLVRQDSTQIHTMRPREAGTKCMTVEGCDAPGPPKMPCIPARPAAVKKGLESSRIV